MKKIGLIGGIGPESTLLYYKKLVYQLQREVGPTFFPHLAIESLNVFDVLAFCENKDLEGLVSYLMNGINNLIVGGAEVIALTGNTPHIVFDQLQKSSSVQLISIGILGEYIGRIYEEVKGRPAYTIAEIAGLEIN